jgi:hypothetical protein
VQVPFEQSPHMTLVLGFVGKEKMALMLIVKGKEGEAPSPYHAQLLDQLPANCIVFLGQSPTGWITTELKTVFLKLQIQLGIVGRRPVVINVDGHDSNLNNEELAVLCDEHKILLVIPPSHTSAPVGGMGTQQCDRSRQHGGPIACFKSKMRALLQKQFFAAVRDKDLRGKISIAQIAYLCGVAWDAGFKPELIARLNADCGYFINAEGKLQWDLTRLLAPPTDDELAPAPAPPVSRWGGRAAMQQSQTGQDAALAAAKRDVDGLFDAAAAQRELDGIFAIRQANAQMLVAPAPAPAHKIDRTAATRKHSRHGVVVGRTEWAVARDDADARATSSAAKKVASERKFWESRRAAVRAAERALEAKAGDPSQLQIGQLKALIVSRTGKTHKAKNNNDGAMLVEARAALAAQSATRMPATPPPTPSRAQLASCDPRGCDDGGERSGDDDDDDDDYMTCRDCLTACEGGPDENGRFWCATCNARIFGDV